MKLFSVVDTFLLASTSVAQLNPSNDNYFEKIIQGAIDEANTIPLLVNIAVTDLGGLLVAFQRMDSAFPGSIEISLKKARTVSLFNGAFTTIAWYNNKQAGMPSYGIKETNGGLLVSGGGIPPVINGIFLGGIGVSRETVEQDIQIVSAVARAVGGYVNSTGTP